jgi:AIPR protein
MKRVELQSISLAAGRMIRSQANPAVMIAVKIIATEDEEMTRQVIIASNQQNKVDQESFWRLTPYHKTIEIYFESKSGDQRLYYQRRPGQFNTITVIEKDESLQGSAS